MSLKKPKKLILISLIAILLVSYLYLMISKTLNESSFFFIYNTIIILSLPFIVAKYLFWKKKLKINPSLLFIIYPTIYFLMFLVSKILPINLESILYLSSITITVVWNALTILLIYNLKWKEIARTLKPNLYLIPSLLIYIIIFLLIRDKDSIVALDYLQHFSVSEKMKSGELLCLIPNQCSELFLQVGYSTIYHTILGFLTSFNNENPLRAIFFIDLVYPLFLATLAFNLFRKFSKNLITIAIFSLVTILIFVSGSYEATFLIPQTLAFIIFLIALLEKETETKTLILIGVLLTLTHFIIGPFLFVFLLIKHFLIEKLDLKTLKSFSKPIFFFTLFTPTIFLIINSSGFTIESVFQKSAVENIGGFTNLPFPENLLKYIGIWGSTGIFLLFSIFFQEKKNTRWFLYSLIYISLTLCIYLLAPTYANKFLIGISIFSVILIIKYLNNLKDKNVVLLVSLIILVAITTNFYFNYSDYLNFYRQNDNTATALPFRDQYVLKHIKQMDSECIFVSDPLTQIQIEGLAGKKTARAQYISPESRREIYNFISNPLRATFQDLLEIEELGGREMCFVYSSRLHTSVERQFINWTFHIYSLPKDNSIPVQESKIKAFMENLGYKTNYQDPNFIVFVKD